MTKAAQLADVPPLALRYRPGEIASAGLALSAEKTAGERGPEVMDLSRWVSCNTVDRLCTLPKVMLTACVWLLPVSMDKPSRVGTRGLTKKEYPNRYFFVDLQNPPA
jgi:hypothetical protein